MIGFNHPYLTGNEIENILIAHKNSQLAGDGNFSRQCQAWLQEQTGSSKVLLTHSCTAALEMAALLLQIEPGDEIIMPSYTFVSTANAFVLRGGIPVFIDIRQDNLNMNEALIQSAITEKTKAIVPVHYAGVACEMDTILSLGNKNGLKVIEDAAQGVFSFYKGRPLGAIGDIGAFSFHETKNVIAGEGGAILVNNPNYLMRSEIIREKGTNRSQFFEGIVDKYTWQDVGSSFLPGEISAAFLLAQLHEAYNITQARLALWNYYFQALGFLEDEGLITRPSIPKECQHNGHIFYIIIKKGLDRNQIIKRFKNLGIGVVFHYVPLHSSPGGMKFGRISGDLSVTEDLSERIIRLPLWIGLTAAQQDEVIYALKNILRST